MPRCATACATRVPRHPPRLAELRRQRGRAFGDARRFEFAGVLDHPERVAAGYCQTGTDTSPLAARSCACVGRARRMTSHPREGLTVMLRLRAVSGLSPTGSSVF